MSVASTIVGLVTKPIASVVEKWIDRKKAKDGLKAKAVMAKQEDATKITLTDAEWESIAQQNQDTTWKDEFVTFCIMYPFVGIFVGTTHGAWTGDQRILEGTLAGIDALQGLGVDLGELMWIVVLAAVGLKIWRKA